MKNLIKKWRKQVDKAIPLKVTIRFYSTDGILTSLTHEKVYLPNKGESVILSADRYSRVSVEILHGPTPKS